MKLPLPIGLLLISLFFIVPLMSQSNKERLGIMNRLIEIKYSTELFASLQVKKESSKDSALAIYNLIRWKIDGLIYQLSADMIADNSSKRFYKLNQWSLENTDSPVPLTLKSNQIYVDQIISIEKDFNNWIRPALPATQSKTLNLTTNVFYLIKDSWSVVKGLSDLKTQKLMALIELLDQTRLISPMELMKQIK